LKTRANSSENGTHIVYFLKLAIPLGPICGWVLNLI